MKAQVILLDKKDHVIWITLNRPEALNALNSNLWRALYEALDMAEKDEDVRVVAITGAGRAFSAGDDIKEVAKLRSPKEIRTFFTQYAAPAITKIIELSKPVIAAVNGVAYGGGCEIAMLCDLVVASEDALFAVPEGRVGAFPPIASAIGAYLLGKLEISMLALTGEPITAKEAHRMGLTNMVVPAEELKRATEEMAQKIMLTAPTSIKTIKKMLNKQFRPEELKQAVEQLIALFEIGEAKEGHDAFVKKRPPKWTVKT